MKEEYMRRHDGLELHRVRIVRDEDGKMAKGYLKRGEEPELQAVLTAKNGDFWDCVVYGEAITEEEYRA